MQRSTFSIGENVSKLCCGGIRETQDFEGLDRGDRGAQGSRFLRTVYGLWALYRIRKGVRVKDIIRRYPTLFYIEIPHVSYIGLPNYLSFSALKVIALQIPIDEM
ncbi:hypothetical protein WG66_001598 [Moniliophthora roreri]|nr:hypothetical protein WG66_001598 [Moniliophthora roreri]